MKTARFLSSRLAAKAGTRTATLHVKADTAGDQIGAAIRGVEQALLANMRPGIGHISHNYHTALAYLQTLPEQIWHALRVHVSAMLLWSHHEAAGAMLRTLPKAYLRASIASRLQESRAVKLMEHGPIVFSVAPPILPDVAPLFKTEAPVLQSAQEETLWRDFLFPPPSADRVRSILDVLLPPRVVQGRLFDVIGTPERGETPPSLAMKIGTLYSEGRSTQEVGRAIRPYFDGSAMRAERSARTLGAYVGTERNLATSEALGDLVMGYQVHSAGGENARHNHAMRSGTVYYRKPVAGQHGMDVMPHPPVDTGKGPYDGEKAGLQYNCRCWTTPVLRPLDAMQTPAFTDNADKLIPDPSHFADWFEQANPQQRAKAAGVRRLQAAADKWGFVPTWSDIVNPETGKLLSVEQIANETNEEWIARKAAVFLSIERNRYLTKRVAAYGTA